MSIIMSERKADKSLYKDDSQSHIPVACQYDKYTVLMKDGHCAQTIKITGLESDNISNEISNIRSFIKASLSRHLDDSRFACWIHTIRRPIDMYDKSIFPSQFASDFNQAWVEKNNLNNKYVNALYITIVHIGQKLALNNIDDLSQMSVNKTVVDNHDLYMSKAIESLNNVVESISRDLSTFNPQRMGIRYENDKCYNDSLFIYKRILGLKRKFVELPIGDFSFALGSSKYAVGANTLEVLEDNEKRFGAILSLREYSNSSNDNLLDDVMNLPIEFIATEIFYAINKKTASAPYSHQKYILDVSKDLELISMKGLNGFANEEMKSGFCNQQISITIVSESLDKLESRVTKVSKALASLGLVNVREDINLENVFWSQIPGNFKYIRRATPNTMDHIGVFASLEDLPVGSRRTRIGSEVSVLSTINNTPYFFNFHQSRDVGHTLIYGNLHSGKSVLVNFLMTYATKYNPTIVFLNTNNSAEVLIDLIGGNWSGDAKIPIYGGDSAFTISLLLDVMSSRYSKGISDDEQKFLDDLIEKIGKTDSISDALKKLNNIDIPESFSAIKAGFSNLKEYLNAANIAVEEGNITGINCTSGDKALDGDLKAAFVLAALRSMSFSPDRPKFLVLDEATYFLDHPYFEHNIDQFLDIAESYNIAIIGLVDTDKYITIRNNKLWQRMKERLDLEIVMYHKKINYSLVDVCGLTEKEEDLLLSSEDKRCCILKPQGSDSVVLQMNIQSLLGRSQVFCPTNETIEKYKKFTQSFKGKNEDFLPELYKVLGEK